MSHLTAIAGARPDPIEWIEREFWIPELNGPIQLAPYQKRCLTEALSTDARGLFRYSTIVWSDIKKSAKSTIAAAVAAWMCASTPFGQVVSVANDLKQADSRVAYYYRRALQLNKRLGARAVIHNYKATWDNGTLFEAVPIDPTGEAGGGADMVCFCLDEQTEVLTIDGWKGHETLSECDWIATRAPDGSFEWQKPKGIYRASYKGKMVRVTHRAFDALVTPNHRMFGRFIGGRGVAPGPKNCQSAEYIDALEDRFVSAKDARKCIGYFPVRTSLYRDGQEAFVWHIPSTGKQPAIDVGQKDYAEFMGWYLSEGCAIKKRGKVEGFCIGQSEKNAKERADIIALLKRIGFTPHEWAGGMNIAVYNAEAGRYLARFGLSDEKFIPEHIKRFSLDSLSAFLDAYIAGDGCVNWRGGITIVTRSLTMRDDLACIAQMCGYAITTSEYVDHRWKGHPVLYCIYLYCQDPKRRGKVEKKHWSTEDYDGAVFCPSTPNGVIYARRNGTYYWTGNSELWGSHSKAQQAMWAEMTLSPLKFGRSFRWVESYAGYTGESPTLEMLYRTGKEEGRQLWPDLPVWVNDSARLFLLWNETPRLPWQTAEYYATEAATLLPAEFERLHRNRWVSSEAQFVPDAWWAACKSELPEIQDNECAVFALDAGVSNDCFAIVGVIRDPANPSGVVVRYARAWKPEGGQQLDFAEPEAEIRRIAEGHNVVEWAYDPYQLHSMCTRLGNEGVGWFREFKQGEDRTVADKQLFDLIRDRHIRHGGDPTLTQHVQNANAKNEGENKLRIVKRADHLKIDLTVALSMATAECLRLNL